MKKIFSMVVTFCLILALGACNSNAKNGSETESEAEGTDTTGTDVESLVDFCVEVSEYKDPVVLQLTDPQIMDSAQVRTDDRLSSEAIENLAISNADKLCYSYMRETIEKTKPDLIILTGDMVYGEFDDNGTVFTAFVEFMDSFGIPWAPVFGNHEAESKKGVDWQCEQLENAKHCLFKQRDLIGNGNYTVGITQGGKLKRVFFMLDSNGYTDPSDESMENYHTNTTAGFAWDQIMWYTDAATQITLASPETKLSFAFHIQLQAFADAYSKYGFDDENTETNPINIDKLDNSADSDFGYLGRNLKGPWDRDYLVWNGIKDLGVDSVFVGHEHCNSASVVYDGIRCQFGQKSSAYDRINYYNEATGSIVSSSSKGENFVPLVGGTVIQLSAKDGSISEPYIYLCDNAGGKIDWDK